MSSSDDRLPQGEPTLSELTKLVSAYCDDALSKEEFNRLQNALEGNPQALNAYLDIVDVHGDLDWLVTSGDCDGKKSPRQMDSRDHGMLNRIPHKAYFAFGALAATLLLMFRPGFREEPPKISAIAIQDPVATVRGHSPDSRWIVVRATGSPVEMKPSIEPNETVQLTSGELAVDFANGAEVTMISPAALQVVSPERAVAIRGIFNAHVTEEAIGFSIDTPRATVVDKGTRFSLEVDELGGTDVVVSEGEVDLSYGPNDAEADMWSQRTMRIGEGVRVDGAGKASRIVALDGNRFRSGLTARPEETRLISELRDNIRDENAWNYYEIIPRGLQEDAKAFADRLNHEWNGVDQRGMPEYLRNADYIKPFNSDKVDASFELTIGFSRPVELYIMFDDRVPTPEWLRDNFQDTGDDIGLDCGPFRKSNGSYNRVHSPGVGAGVSIDMVHSIWKRRIETPSSFKLGSIWSPEDDPAGQNLESVSSMYGIAIVPIVIRNGDVAE